MNCLLFLILLSSTISFAQVESRLGQRKIVVLFKERVSCLGARGFLKDLPVDFVCSLNDRNKKMAYTVIYSGKSPVGGILKKIISHSAVEVATVNKSFALPQVQTETSEP